MATKLSELEVPTLNGWMTLPEAAKELGFSRQYAYKRAADGYFESLHRIGESTFIVSTDDVLQKKALRQSTSEK